jgi:hypothetical protein
MTKYSLPSSFFSLIDLNLFATPPDDRLWDAQAAQTQKPASNTNAQSHETKDERTDAIWNAYAAMGDGRDAMRWESAAGRRSTWWGLKSNNRYQKLKVIPDDGQTQAFWRLLFLHIIFSRACSPQEHAASGASSTPPTRPADPIWAQHLTILTGLFNVIKL